MDGTTSWTFRSCLSSQFALYRSAPPAAGGLSVTGIGRHRVTQAITARKLPDFAVVLVEDGQGWLETKVGGRQAIEAPALFWLFPGKTHSYGPDVSGWLERWALFDGALTRDFTRLRLIAEDAPVVPLQDLGEMQRLFDRLHGELSLDTVLSQAEAAATMHRIVVRAARQAADRSNRERDPAFSLPPISSPSSTNCAAAPAIRSTSTPLPRNS